MLEFWGFVDQAKATSTDQEVYYRIPAGMKPKQKEQWLLEAFHRGAVVVMDEINSSPMLERLLNTLLMGKDLSGNMGKPGFLIIGTQNPIYMAGRKATSMALQRRMMKNTFTLYTQQELFEILCHRHNIPEERHEWLKAIIYAYQTQLDYARKHQLEPAPTLRDLINVVGESFNKQPIIIERIDPEDSIFQKQTVWFEQKILRKKTIKWLNPLQWLEKNKKEILLQSDIKDHCQWVYESIYQHPYEGYQNARPRGAHGIAHASRVSIWAKVFVHLYKLFGNQEADNAFALEEDVKLIQIAALFHDVGREKSGKDLWDCDSALMFYYYLTQILSEEQLNEKREKIILLAEALANKDAKPGGSFYKLAFNAGEPFWKKEVAGEKTIWQKIIHDADCLDVIRVRLKFEIEFLDCYQDIQQEPDGNKRSIWGDALKRVVLEATEIIALEGDGYRSRGFLAQLSRAHKMLVGRQSWYELGFAYARIEADIMANTNYIKQFYGFENPVQVDRNDPEIIRFFFNGISSLVSYYPSTQAENYKYQKSLVSKINALAWEDGELEEKTQTCIRLLWVAYNSVFAQQGFIKNRESGILKSIRLILPTNLCGQLASRFLEKRAVENQEVSQAALEFIEQRFDRIVIKYRDFLFDAKKPGEEVKDTTGDTVSEVNSNNENADTEFLKDWNIIELL